MKKFTKKLVVMSMLVAGISGLVACGGKDGENKEASQTKVELSAAEIANKLKDGGEYKDTIEEVDSDVAIERLYDLDSSKIADAAFYTNTNATAEEIAVIKVSDSAYAADVKAAFETRVADQKEACEDYLPDELPKLDNAVIKTSGDYTVLVISVDSSKINSVLSSIGF